MKAERFATIKNGKIHEMTDCSRKVELKENQIPLTSNELALIRACDGDLGLAETIIREIKERIAKVAV